MKPAAFALAASLAAVSHADAGSLEGTYSGWIKWDAFESNYGTYTVSEVKGGRALVRIRKWPAVEARVDGDSLTFESHPNNVAKATYTMTIRGNHAVITIRNRQSGASGRGDLNRD